MLLTSQKPRVSQGIVEEGLIHLASLRQEEHCWAGGKKLVQKPDVQRSLCAPVFALQRQPSFFEGTMIHFVHQKQNVGGRLAGDDLMGFQLCCGLVFHTATKLLIERECKGHWYRTISALGSQNLRVARALKAQRALRP